MMKIFNYKIEKIVKTKFYLIETDKIDKLQFSLSFQFKVNVEDEIICCVSKYTYKDSQAIVMELELECYFKTKDGYFNSQVQGSVLKIDTDVLQYLATIAVGTARGEIHARCEAKGSVLQDMVLPPVNITEIITSQAEFRL